MNTIGMVMRACRHYFPVDWVDGMWTVCGGVLTPEVSDGLIAVAGSMRHNGVWRVEDGKIETDEDESWNGRVWRLAPPADFLALCGEIDRWRAEHPDDVLKSERFGEYGCEFATGKDGKPLGWQEVFAKQLQMYKRMFSEVDVDR